MEYVVALLAIILAGSLVAMLVISWHVNTLSWEVSTLKARLKATEIMVRGINERSSL